MTKDEMHELSFIKTQRKDKDELPDSYRSAKIHSSSEGPNHLIVTLTPQQAQGWLYTLTSLMDDYRKRKEEQKADVDECYVVKKKNPLTDDETLGVALTEKSLNSLVNEKLEDVAEAQIIVETTKLHTQDEPNRPD